MLHVILLTVTLRNLLATQREMILITVSMTALILIFSGGESGLRDTALITAIYATVAGNMVRFSVPVAARRLARLPAPQNYLLLLLAFGVIGLVAGGVATAALLGISDAFDLYAHEQVRRIGRNAIELTVLVSVIAGVISSMGAQRRAELEATIEGQREEFARAKEIQLGLLPKRLPTLPGYAAGGHWQPARMIGGDYYDLWRIGEAHAGLCIADVSGKGAAAALLMANLQAAVRVTALTAFSPADLCTRLNAVLKDNLGRGRFVTLFVGLLELRTGRLVYANAGHCPPLHLTAGQVSSLAATGPAIGLVTRAAYRDAEVTLESGDRLLLFTDGLSEAGIDGATPFDEARIALALREHATPERLVQALAVEAEVASGGPDLLHDDLTMLAVLRTE